MYSKVECIFVSKFSVEPPASLKFFNFFFTDLNKEMMDFAEHCSNLEYSESLNDSSTAQTIKKGIQGEVPQNLKNKQSNKNSKSRSFKGIAAHEKTSFIVSVSERSVTNIQIHQIVPDSNVRLAILMENPSFVNICGILIVALVLATTVINCEYLQTKTSEGSILATTIFLGLTQFYQFFKNMKALKASASPNDRIKLFLKMLLFYSLDPNHKQYAVKEIAIISSFMLNAYVSGSIISQKAFILCLLNTLIIFVNCSLRSLFGKIIEQWTAYFTNSQTITKKYLKMFITIEGTLLFIKTALYLQPNSTSLLYTTAIIAFIFTRYFIIPSLARLTFSSVVCYMSALSWISIATKIMWNAGDVMSRSNYQVSIINLVLFILLYLVRFWRKSMKELGDLNIKTEQCNVSPSWILIYQVQLWLSTNVLIVTQAMLFLGSL